MSKRKHRRKAEEGVPQPAKSEDQVKKTDENAERGTSILLMPAVLDALPEQVRISVVEAASLFRPSAAAIHV